MASNPLQGSERSAMPGAHAVGAAAPDERLEVTLVLRRRGAAVLLDRAARLLRGERFAQHLSREQFAEQFGHDPADVARVGQFAHDFGLVVVDEHAARRTMVLSGTVTQFNAAFGVELQTFEHPGGSYRGRTGPIHLTDALAGIVEGVFGLDNRPQATPHFRVRGNPGNVRWHGQAGASISYTPPQVARMYGFPSATGQGQCIAIIELGGGYRGSDLQTYFKSLGIATPKVTAVSVDHGRNNATGDGNGPDGEVMLDIEVAASVAPAASIVVYFSPNTDAGFMDAVTTAVHDTTNRPSVVSISWGGPESSWTSQAMSAFDSALQDAATLGVTVCVASGDNGSGDGVTDGANHVDFPASSPFSLACGGTNLQGSGSQISAETVWNDGANGGSGGGGVSAVFALPTWQGGLSATATAGGATPLAMRGVPDVCGDADPASGYQVRVDGQSAVIGGTSAVAPLWAGLVAQLNSLAGKSAGYLNPVLYAHGDALNDISLGNNGAYAASAGWDACTGLGSPNGPKLAALFTPVSPPLKG
jgi:kumamolisin